MSLAAEAAGSLFAAGVVAGIIGSGGGVTSLVSYPALLVVGSIRPGCPLPGRGWGHNSHDSTGFDEAARGMGSSHPLLQLGLVGAVCVYGGYFGAGSGVMLLAVILVLVDSRIAPGNAIKNVLLGVTSLVAAAVFIATGPVLWAAVLPLAGGLLVGSALGPIIVRHLPPNLVRWMAATFGFILAIYLWIRPP